MFLPRSPPRAGCIGGAFREADGVVADFFLGREFVVKFRAKFGYEYRVLV